MNRIENRRIIFVCSPYAADPERNTVAAQNYCSFVVDEGAQPIAPHLMYPQFLDDTKVSDRVLGLQFGLTLLLKCDELWAFGGYASFGMTLEIDTARQHDMQIKYFNKICEEVPSFA